MKAFMDACWGRDNEDLGFTDVTFKSKLSSLGISCLVDLREIIWENTLGSWHVFLTAANTTTTNNIYIYIYTG